MKILERERTETVCVPFDEWEAAVDQYGVEEAASLLKPRYGDWEIGVPRTYFDLYMYVTFTERTTPAIQ